MVINSLASRLYKLTLNTANTPMKYIAGFNPHLAAADFSFVAPQSIIPLPVNAAFVVGFRPDLFGDF